MCPLHLYERKDRYPFRECTANLIARPRHPAWSIVVSDREYSTVSGKAVSETSQEPNRKSLK